MGEVCRQEVRGVVFVGEAPRRDHGKPEAAEGELGLHAVVMNEGVSQSHRELMSKDGPSELF
jgi:hypothetical protein